MIDNSLVALDRGSPPPHMTLVHGGGGEIFL